LVDEVRPSVVNIYTTNAGVNARGRQKYRPFDDFDQYGLPPDRLLESLGSGFLISDDGYILTNNHVIEGASFIKVRLYDEREFQADIIGTDPKTDLALIKIEAAANLKALPLGDSTQLRVGDWVVAIGNPLGLSSTVTAGIVSARGRRDVPLGGEITYMDFIQTDASINPGNSGGPLIDVQGRVIGINTAISRQGQGIGFAIPINMAKDILHQLQTTGRVVRSWIGAYIDEVPADVAKRNKITPGSGAMIDRVVIGGPAHQAGLKSGDVVTRFGTHDIKKSHDLRWLASTIGVGETVEIQVLRDGTTMTFKMTTKEQPK